MTTASMVNENDKKPFSAKELKEIVSLLDLTSLNDNDTEETIKQLCCKAVNDQHNVSVAAVCIYKQFIPTVKEYLLKNKIKNVKIATVVNFPGGDYDVEGSVEETIQALKLGADEVDLVFPYKLLCTENDARDRCLEMVKKVKHECVQNEPNRGVQLKVILETGGEGMNPQKIKEAAEISIEAGCNFIKTSTGKTPICATIEAARIMLSVIKEKNVDVGFKASGGIRRVEEALSYMALARDIMGSEWLNSNHFRFGASSLLGNVEKHLSPVTVKSKQCELKEIITLLDLTSLNDNDTKDSIEQLCSKAYNRKDDVSVAALCIYTPFIPIVSNYLKEHSMEHIKIATVVNFPGGEYKVEESVEQTSKAIELGCNEVDLVFPYKLLCSEESGVTEKCLNMIKMVKNECSRNQKREIKLKVILETGANGMSPEKIKLASEISIEAGCDFIKTSTGKVPISATLQAARIMLTAIKEKNCAVGFKASGGIRKADEALSYIALAREIMGNEWVNPAHFRFGASSLLGNVEKELVGIAVQTSNEEAY